MFMSADLDELLERSDRIAVFSGGVMSRVLPTSDLSVEALGYLIGGKAEEQARAQEMVEGPRADGGKQR
jgi:simple sugar transport system ATP-binding protein